MITAAQIRAMIQQLTSTKISLDDFEEWMTAASWNMHKESSDPDAIRMVGKFELYLAESAQKKQEEIIGNLASIAGVFQIGETPGISVTTAGTASQTIPLKYQFELSADAGKQFEKEFSYTLLLPA